MSWAETSIIQDDISKKLQISSFYNQRKSANIVAVTNDTAGSGEAEVSTLPYARPAYSEIDDPFYFEDGNYTWPYVVDCEEYHDGLHILVRYENSNPIFHIRHFVYDGQSIKYVCDCEFGYLDYNVMEKNMFVLNDSLFYSTLFYKTSTTYTIKIFKYDENERCWQLFKQSDIINNDSTYTSMYGHIVSMVAYGRCYIKIPFWNGAKGGAARYKMVTFDGLDLTDTNPSSLRSDTISNVMFKCDGELFEFGVGYTNTSTGVNTARYSYSTSSGNVMHPLTPSTYYIYKINIDGTRTTMTTLSNSAPNVLIPRSKSIFTFGDYIYIGPNVYRPYQNYSYTNNFSYNNAPIIVIKKDFSNYRFYCDNSTYCYITYPNPTETIDSITPGFNYTCAGIYKNEVYWIALTEIMSPIKLKKSYALYKLVDLLPENTSNTTSDYMYWKRIGMQHVPDGLSNYIVYNNEIHSITIKETTAINYYEYFHHKWDGTKWILLNVVSNILEDMFNTSNSMAFRLFVYDNDLHLFYRTSDGIYKIVKYDDSNNTWLDAGTGIENLNVSDYNMENSYFRNIYHPSSNNSQIVVVNNKIYIFYSIYALIYKNNEWIYLHDIYPSTATAVNTSSDREGMVFTYNNHIYYMFKSYQDYNQNYIPLYEFVNDESFTLLKNIDIPSDFDRRANLSQQYLSGDIILAPIYGGQSYIYNDLLFVECGFINQIVGTRGSKQGTWRCGNGANVLIIRLSDWTMLSAAEIKTYYDRMYGYFRLNNCGVYGGSKLILNNQIHLLGTGIIRYFNSGYMAYSNMTVYDCYSIGSNSYATSNMFVNSQDSMASHYVLEPPTEIGDVNYSWSYFSDFNQYRGAAVEIDGIIHIMGGGKDEDATKHYSWDGTEWTSESTLPYEFSCGSAVVLNDSIHILGGIDEDTYTNHYSWDGTEWASESTLPFPFTNGAAVVLNDEIHILGTSTGNDGDCYKHYKWDGSEWTEVSTLPYKFWNGCAAVLNGKINIVGGGDFLKYHYEYQNGEWIKLPDLEETFERGAIVVFNGEIHLLGGSSHGFLHEKLYGNTTIIKNKRRLPYDFFDGDAVVVDDEIHLLGGGRDRSSKGATSHYKIFDTGARPIRLSDIELFIY